MHLGKIFLLIVAVWLLLTIIKSYRRNIGTPPGTKEAGDIVRCENCGVHIPIQESVQKNGRYFCCAAHSEAGQTK